MQKKISYFSKIISFLFFLFSTCASANFYNAAAAHIQTQLGLAYLQKGMYPEAKKSLFDALNEDPKLASTWYNMGYFLEVTGHFESAENDYLKAIAVKPHSGSAKNNFGAFLCREGHEKKAIKEFLAATREPDYLNEASAYENAGKCALMMHNKKLAISYFKKAISNNPNMPFSLLSLARLNSQMGHPNKKLE